MQLRLVPFAPIGAEVHSDIEKPLLAALSREVRRVELRHAIMRLHHDEVSEAVGALGKIGHVVGCYRDAVTTFSRVFVEVSRCIRRRHLDDVGYGRLLAWVGEGCEEPSGFS